MKIQKLIISMLTLLYLLPGQLPVHGEEEQELHVGHFDNYAQYENASAAGRLSAANEDGAAEVTETLPASFDLRQKGLVSSVKSQLNYGICWSFSAIGCLENTLITRNPLIDLSEWHLAYYAYSDKFGFTLKNNTDQDDIFQQGGNFYMLAPMLTSWTGPVSESVFPFNDFNILDPGADWNAVKAKAEYHVSDANLFTYHIEEESFADQRKAVQQAIYEGHTVSMSYYNKSVLHDTNKHSYYFSLDEKTGGTYHAVTIVGWDDHYSAKNFKTSPPGSGAWLVRNSWGENWGDYGYFWISYYDPSMVEFYYLETEPLQKHNKIYQYDDYGYWTAFSVEPQESSAYVANVFTAEKDTYLTSVMLCNAMPDEQYTIKIYTDPGKKPNTGKESSVTSASVKYSGYHTIDLTTPVKLTKGQKFSIVAQVSGEEGQHITCEAYMKNTVTQKNGAVSIDSNMLTEEMIRRDFHQGESFYSTDGRIWYDIYQEDAIEDSYTMDDDTKIDTYAVLGNICLRGLTQDAGVILFSETEDALPTGTKITLSSPEGNEIYYSINGGKYQLYTQPLVMPEEEIQISAYANTGENIIYEKSYAVQKAQPSSILYIEDGKAEYLKFVQIGDSEFEAVHVPSENAQVISLLPMTTGQIMSDGKAFPSGVVTTILNWKEKDSIILHVAQAGMKATDYRISFRENKQIFELGDVNQDQNINAVDAAEILIYAVQVGCGAEPETYPDEWRSHADYNQDGEINATDAALILKFAAENGASS